MDGVIIIGGGASGIFCAIQLAKYGKKVTLLEKSERVGKKLLSTGNGKCNFTNVNITIKDYNTPIIKDILEEFPPRRIIDEFASLGLLSKVDSEGRVYPYSESGSSVLNVLLRRLDEYGVRVVYDCFVEKITPVKGGYRVATGKGEYEGNTVVFAFGSNATSGHDSLSLMQSLGHKVVPFRYAITQLLCDGVKGLNGVRAKAYASIHIDGKEVMGERGELLFKDDALSGILAFRLSSAYARRMGKINDCKVKIDFLPDIQERELADFILDNCSVYAPLEGILHKAIASKIIATIPMDRSLILSRKKVDDLARACKNFEVNILGVGGRANSQVACGGVSLDELDSNTLQSKLHEGLYCVGEGVDVDGLCGGCNLHWAWASAMAVSKALL